MADKYVNELPQETYNTLDGTEQFVMFDVAEGKRSTLNTIGNYVLSKMTPDNLDKSVTGTISDMQTDIDTLQLAVGSPLVAETVSNMTDTTKIYVYVGNETGYTAGNWYYWNGTGWVSGGVYNAEAVATDTTLAVSGAPADSKATGDALDTKVDKVTGKGLSTEDYTTEEKTKLSGIATGATNVVIDNTLTTTGQAADAKKTGDEISDLKEDLSELETDISNGNFPEMSVGSADQLISDGYVVENEPYQFRKSGGSADIGTRMEDVIVGGSIVWNQLVQNGNFESDTNWNYSLGASHSVANNILTFTASGYRDLASIGVSIINTHKCLCTADIKLTTGTPLIRFGLLINNGNNWAEYKFTASTADWQNLSFICSPSLNVGANQMMIRDERSENFDAIQVKNVMLIDLTTMFGSTIADYIYSLEQANQGDGVAFFRKFFPNDYYAYNAGELMSVGGLSEHKTCGKNLLAITPYGGIYNAETGADLKTNTPMPCSVSDDGTATLTANAEWSGRLFATGRLSGGTYLWPYHRFNSGNIRLTFYITDENLNVIAVIANQSSEGNYQSREVEVEAGNRIAIYFGCAGTAGTYNIESFYIPLDSSYTYEPYDGHSYPLDDSLTLRGIPKLDSNNQLYFDGDRYLANGVVERRYKLFSVNDFNNSMITFNDNPVWLMSYDVNGVPSTDYSAISNYLRQGTYDELFAGVKNIVCQNYQGRLYASIDGVTDNNSLSTWLQNHSDIQVVASLATPTTEQATPYHNPQIVDSEGTEEYICTSLVPVGHETKYFEDLKGKIEGLPSNFATLIADTEKTFKATKNYSQGDYLIVNNQLYKVTSAITSGSTITPNTNVTATTIMAEIMALA